MPQRSWSASLLGFALTVLVACLALKLAAEFLLAALPVLLPTAALGLGLVAAIRWWRSRDYW